MEPNRIQSVSPHDHSLPMLDGLRGLAVGLVLLVHLAFEMRRQIPSASGVKPLLDGGDILIGMGGTGVHLFFVLSGFLLFLPYARHVIAGARRPTTSHFLLRRALRILPAYYFVLAFDIAFFETSAVKREPAEQLISHALLVHNYSQLTFRGLDGPTWTMAVEAQFYVLLPLVGLIFAWLVRRGLRAVALGAVLLTSLSTLTAGLSVILNKTHPGFGPYSTVLSTPEFLSVFGMGILCACVYVHITEAPQAYKSHQRLLVRVSGTVFAVIFSAVAVKQAAGVATPTLDYYFYGPLMGLCYAGLLLAVVLGTNRARQILSSPGPRFLGDISFSLYLIHYPVIEHLILPVAAKAGSGVGPLFVTVLGVVLVLIPLSFACFWFVERPFLRAKAHVLHPSDEAAPVMRLDRES